LSGYGTVGMVVATIGSNGESCQGDAWPVWARQLWIVQFRHRVAGIARAVKAVPVRARPGTTRRQKMTIKEKLLEMQREAERNKEHVKNWKEENHGANT